MTRLEDCFPRLQNELSWWIRWVPVGQRAREFMADWSVERLHDVGLKWRGKRQREKYRNHKLVGSPHSALTICGVYLKLNGVKCLTLVGRIWFVVPHPRVIRDHTGLPATRQRWSSSHNFISSRGHSGVWPAFNLSLFNEPVLWQQWSSPHLRCFTDQVNKGSEPEVDFKHSSASRSCAKLTVFKSQTTYDHMTLKSLTKVKGALDF